MLCGGNDLAEVVRGHVGGHAHRDAAGTVDQKVRVGGRQHRRLQHLVVIVGDKVHHVFIQVSRQLQGGRRKARLGVAGGGRAVVERTKVPVPVNERQAQRPVLGHAHHGVVDGGVAVRVQLAHDLAHHAGTLDVSLVRAQPHLAHHVQDAPLHGLEPVAGVRERPGVNHRIGVLQEGAFHLT